jgi:hypothetical protein
MMTSLRERRAEYDEKVEERNRHEMYFTSKKKPTGPLPTLDMKDFMAKLKEIARR